MPFSVFYHIADKQILQHFINKPGEIVSLAMQ